MAQIWNTLLPDPEGTFDASFISGLSGANHTGFAESNRRTGDIKNRVKWLFNQAEFELFKSFFDITLIGGTDWFTADWMRKLCSDAAYLRFSQDGYTASLDEILWIVEAELEVIR